MASFGHMVIRGVFATAEHLAPNLAGRAAFRLFSRTPDPGRLPQREKRRLAEAREWLAEARHHRLTTRYGVVVAHEFRPVGRPKPWPTALVLHGWRSRTEHMRQIVDGLVRAGHRVVALDLPGHGGSPGRRLHMANAVAAVATAAEWFGPLALIVGHSFGGAVAVNAAVGSIRGIKPVRVGRLVLIAAPSSMPAIFTSFGGFLGLGPRTQTALADAVERLAGNPLETFVGARQLAELPIPTLVVHAPDDRQVAAANAEAFAAAGPHVRLSWAPGQGHRRIIADPQVVGEIVRFAAPGPRLTAVS
ncbi:alpha/beta fold hydrolase [Aquibium sp. A9E412]|uniref:alpha/beta hydrolase n=1 Tax=Aquibium sp. A9E412 TaxID=2976767 RepID=UPI0025B17DCC|nr:alpha/beta fold hydrolase [Aquibium sp. A9E412]MDN2567672.1 alpha/beta fold hydrolase [Aquibium sp. A9E412]